MPKEIKITSVLNKTKKRDEWFLDDYTLNLYSSCSFNCLYCYIRGSKYGTNLANSLSAKINSIEVLDRQLYNRAKKNQYGIIALSSATDPYMPIEEEYKLTRQALEVILKHKFPVHIITKSNIIERDFDLLHQINNQAILPTDLKNRLGKGVIISFSFSTLDDHVATIFEKGATKPSQRLITLNHTVKESFLTGVSMMPLLPFISDTTESLELLFSTFKKSNVNYILPATLTLFGQDKTSSKSLMLNAIKKHYPHLENRYLNYFNNGSEMPTYYQVAFANKMRELCQKFELSNSIRAIK